MRRVLMLLAVVVAGCGDPAPVLVSCSVPSTTGGGAEAMAIDSPADVSDLILWVRAESITGLSDNDGVAQWDDESGENNHLVQPSSASQPLYRTAQAVTNDWPSVEFSSGTMAFQVPNLFSGLAAGEIFLVLRTFNDPTTHSNTSGLSVFGTTSDATHYPYTDGTIYEGFGSTTRKTVGNPAASLTDVRVYSIYSAANDWQAFLDGVSLHSTATNTVGWSTDPVLGKSLGTRYLRGNILAVVAYGRKLTTTERADVVEYLQQYQDPLVTSTVTVDTITETTCDVTGSYGGNETVLDTEVRVRRTSGEILYGPTSLGGTPTWPHTTTGLPGDTRALVAEVRWQQDTSGWTDWTTSVEFRTLPPALVDPLVPEERTRSGAWTRNDPRSIHYNGVTYYAGATNEGVYFVASVNHSTGAAQLFELTGPTTENAHRSPVLRVRSDGRIQAFYTGHSSGALWHRTSTNPEDVTEWDAEQSITSGGPFTYPNVVNLSDRVVLHWRRYPVATPAFRYTESTDDGATWGTQRILVANSPNRPYVHLAKHPTTDRIDYVVSTGHPGETASSLYHFYRDADGDFRESDGTLIGDVGDLPLAPSDGTTVWDAVAEGEDAWQWDIAHDRDGEPVILFARHVSNSDRRMMYARWDGTEWLVTELAQTGARLTSAGESAGGALDHDDDTVAWIAQVVDSSTAHLYKYTTANRGATWSGENMTPGATDQSIMPVVPRGRAADVGVLWPRGVWDRYDDFDTAIYSLGVEAEGEAVPDAPVIDASVQGTTVQAWAEEPFSTDREGAEHTATRWVVEIQGGATVYNEVHTDFLTEIVLGEADGIPETETVEVTAFHRDGERESPASNVVVLETGVHETPPDKSTGTVEEVRLDYVRLSASEFSHPDGVMDPGDFDPGGEEDEEGDAELSWPLAIQFRVRLASVVVADTGLTAIHVEDREATLHGLDDDEDGYVAEVRWQDGRTGLLSEWSDPAPFTTPAIPEDRPGQPTITLDACGASAMEVSSGAMTHPDGGAVHTRSHWRACRDGHCVVRIVEAPDLQSFEWPDPPPGDWDLSVRYEDDLDRIGEYSEPVQCEIPETPPQPLVTSHVGGAVIDADALLEWETDFEPDGGWEYRLRVSADRGQTWTTLQESGDEEHLFTISGRGNGAYLLELRACYPETDFCGEAFFLTLIIDRGGLAAVAYNFPDLVEFPAEWVVRWDHEDQGVHWELVNRDLQPGGDPIGIMARLSVQSVRRQSALVFPELGSPRQFRAHLQFAVLGNELVGFGSRFAYTHLCQGGLGWSMNGRRWESGRQGLMHLANSGVFPWPCPTQPSCDCKAMVVGICEECKAVSLDYQESTTRLYRYATATRRAGVRRTGRAEPVGDPPNVMFPVHNATASVPPSGDRERGMVVGTRSLTPDDPEDPEGPSTCRYTPAWYSMELWVTPRIEGGYRFRQKLVGPGLDPSVDWHLDTTLSASDVESLPCGPCGLAFDQLRGIDQTLGILYRSFAAVLPEGFITDGPISSPGDPVDDTDSGDPAEDSDPPEGLALVAETNMQEPFPWPPAAVTGSTGEWWEFPQDNPNTANVLLDAPGSSGWLNTRFPKGQSPGTAPCNLGGWDEGQAGTEQSRIFFRQRLRLRDTGSGDWESQRVGTKLGFFGVGRHPSNAANEFFPWIVGRPQPKGEFALQMRQQSIRAINYSTNIVPSYRMPVGPWVLWEIEMILNDIGTDNGVLRWWCDGTLVMEHTDVRYRTTTHPYGFYAWKWNPTWGGTGGPAKKRDDWIDISHVRIEGEVL